MSEQKIGSRQKAFCASCKGERNCEIKGHHRVTGSEGNYVWYKDWYLLVCCGCDHVFPGRSHRFQVVLSCWI